MRTQIAALREHKERASSVLGFPEHLLKPKLASFGQLELFLHELAIFCSLERVLHNQQSPPAEGTALDCFFSSHGDDRERTVRYLHRTSPTATETPDIAAKPISFGTVEV